MVQRVFYYTIPFGSKPLDPLCGPDSRLFADGAQACKRLVVVLIRGLDRAALDYPRHRFGAACDRNDVFDPQVDPHNRPAANGLWVSHLLFVHYLRRVPGTSRDDAHKLYARIAGKGVAHLENPHLLRKEEVSVS